MKLAVPVLLSALVSLPAVSFAKSKSKSRSRGGTLSRVVGGLRTDRSDSSSKRSSSRRDYQDSSSDSGGSDGNDDWDDDDWDDDAYDGLAGAGAQIAADAIFSSYPGVRAPSGDTDVDMYTSLMFVKGSDFAVGSNLRVSHEGFTMSAAYGTYIEELPMDETLSLTTWRLAAGRRWTKPGLGSVVVEGGPAGGHSTGLDMIGLVAGASGRLAVGNTLGLDASAHGFIYNEGSSAVELAAGMRMSVIRAGYRWTRFDVGPALEGPEVGLAFSF